MNSSILDYFKKNSAQVFVRSEVLSLTYSECLNVVFYLVVALKQKNLFKKRVLLCMPNSIESQLLFLALAHTNDVTLLSPEHNDSFVENLQQELGVDITVSQKTFANSIDFLQEIKFDIDSSRYHTPQTTELHAGSVCLMTSGTTGKPKTVLIEHDQIIKYGQLLMPHFDIHTTDCLYNIIPFYHGYGLTRLVTVLVSGSSMFVPSTLSVARMVNDINQFCCTWTSLVPRLVKIINKGQGSLWKGFRFATSSASLIDSNSLLAFESTTGKPVFVEYGCSEASIISSNTFKHNRPGSMGQVDKQYCKIQQGRIMVVPRWNDSVDYIDTGDAGFIDADDFLWINGRTKEIIKKNGKTIFPFELEFVIQGFPGVEEVAAYSCNPMTDHESIGIVYVGDCTVESVVALCRQHFLPFYRPDHVTKVDAIPSQGNKIRRLDISDYVNSLQQ
jgi:acyl-CoA synthetase (AMP-forming)/AMP-acid ligase II